MIIIIVVIINITNVSVNRALIKGLAPRCNKI